MKKYYRYILVSCLFALLTGCQSFTNDNLFSFGPSDERITETVNARILANPELAPLNIQVETHQRTVSLSGYVRTIRQSDTAGDIAGKAPGVKMVENNLIVRKY